VTRDASELERADRRGEQRRVVAPDPAARVDGDRLALERRELRSDLLLVKPPGARDWLQLRDVFEVDGLPVIDRSERLTKLLEESSPFPETQIARIIAENSGAAGGAST